MPSDHDLFYNWGRIETHIRDLLEHFYIEGQTIITSNHYTRKIDNNKKKSNQISSLRASFAPQHRLHHSGASSIAR